MAANPELKNSRRLNKIEKLLRRHKERYARNAVKIIAEHFDMNDYVERLAAFNLVRTDFEIALAASATGRANKKKKK